MEVACSVHLCDAPTAHSLISHLNITFSRKSVSVKDKKNSLWLFTSVPFCSGGEKSIENTKFQFSYMNHAQNV